mgnify:CR=1 FL=1
MEFKKGQVVLSKAGRDKGRLLAAVRFEEKRVFLCDGKERPLKRPKVKNLRHVEFTPMFIDEASMETDRKLRKALKQLNDSMI